MLLLKPGFLPRRPIFPPMTGQKRTLLVARPFILLSMTKPTLNSNNNQRYLTTYINNNYQSKRPATCSTVIQHLYKVPRLNNGIVSQTRSAAFWRVGTNLKLFKRILKESGTTQLRYRIVLFLILFVALNFAFNLMMLALTNLYLETLQKTSSSFGLWTNTEFKGGLVNELIKNNDKLANKNYYTCLESLAREHKLDFEESDYPEDLILNDWELENAFLQNQDLQFVSSYCDLLIRFASTFVDKDDGATVQSILTRALEIANTYEESSKTAIGSYLLKNKALRSLADISKLKNEPFEKTEKLLLDSISIVEQNEYTADNINKEDFTVLNNGQLASKVLTNSLLDLCMFYSSTKKDKYLDKSLAILLANLRSLEYEFRLLDNEMENNSLFKKKSETTLKDASANRLNELKFEMIPLVKLQISEILWFKKSYNSAIEFAKDSAHVSSFYSSDNFNSAKIAKIGFDNLAKMFDKLGDKEGAALCWEKSQEIEVPLDAFYKKSGNVRDVVLGYYFGQWGKFLFPG